MGTTPPAIMQTLIALVLGGLALAATGQETRPEAPPEGALREEFFVLETLPADLDPGVSTDLERTHAEALAVGLAAWRRRDDTDGTMLEWDLRFPGEETRVLHIERAAAAGPSLVWREWRADGGRTVIVEPAPEASGGRFRVLEWGQEEPIRGELDASAVLPLTLLERLRAGEIESSTVQVYDPLAGRLEPLIVRTRTPEAWPWPATAPRGRPDSVEASPPPHRLVELVRTDGTLAGAFLFAGAELSAFQWQAGHLRARRIEATEYRRRLRESGD